MTLMQDAMDLRPMTLAELTQWYDEELCEAFLPQERKPFADILALRDTGLYAPLGLFRQKRLLGYAAVWSKPGGGCALLDYLGVTASERGGGLGSLILQRLQAYYSDRRIITEAELPEGADANALLCRRRIAFYMRNGFHPAYEMAACGMLWQVLLTGPEPDAGMLIQIMAEHREPYASAGRADVCIPRRAGQAPVMPHWMKTKKI